MIEKLVIDSMKLDYQKVSDDIADFIKTKVKEQNKDGVCIGISGGIDSAVVLSLAVKAMQVPQKVYGFHLFDRDSQSKFRDYSEALAQEFGINFEVMDISPLIKEQGTYDALIMKIIRFSAPINKLLTSFSRVVYPILFKQSPYAVILKREASQSWFKKLLFSGLVGTIENGFNVRHIQRRKILEDFATKNNLLPLGAANKSEAFVGWFVKDGVDDLPIEPIMGLYKTQVRQLAEYLEINAKIRLEKPSPDMLKGITDENIIGYQYEKIDQVAFALENELDQEALLNAGLTTKEINGIKKLNALSEWKRANPHEFPQLS